MSPLDLTSPLARSRFLSWFLLCFPPTHLASWRFVGAPMGLTRPANCEVKNGRLLLLKSKEEKESQLHSALTCQVMHQVEQSVHGID